MVVEESLLEELSEVSNRIGGVAPLPEESRARELQKISDIYVTDSTSRWWWKHLSQKSKQISYDENDDFSTLLSLVNTQDGCFLVVTDDELPPWPIYSGDIGSIAKVLRECRYFEYFLVSENYEWIVFDTHMNELIVSGSLAKF